MNKTDLREKWGHYCDTDKLVDNTMSLLTKYSHANTEHGVCCMLDTYFTNKRKLIDMFITSEHYIGDMRIMIETEMSRYADRGAIFNFLCCFLVNLKAKKFLVRDVDDNGNKMEHYINAGVERVSVNDILSNTDTVKRIFSNANALSAFNKDGQLLSDVDKFLNLERLISLFKHCASPVVTQRMADEVNATFEDKIAVGMKTSRALNKICTKYGLDKINPQTEIRNDEEVTVYPYNKLFAQYADMVSELKRKIKFFISLNPLDYLTMSFGVSWTSCHTIDKKGIRHISGGHAGMHCNGTLSYMLDESSIITYVHENMPESIEDGKLYRTMFHFQNNVLVQGRVYPQGNDGNNDLYEEFRNIVQTELSKLCCLQNNEWEKVNRKSYICSIGRHYKDYDQHSACVMTKPVEKEVTFDMHHTITIGHPGICPHCGTELTSCNNDMLTHTRCGIGRN